MSPEKENIGGLHNENISMILSEPFMADLSSASMESNKRKDLILYLMPTKIYGVVGTSEDIKLNLTKFKNDFSFTRAFDKMALLLSL